ncbi:MAG: STAS domain-containing protein [Patescibacteria group bacterium]
MTRNDQIEIARLAGHIDKSAAATSFSDHITECLGRNIRGFCLNLEGIEHIDSIGLGLLLSVMIRIKNVGGALTLCCISDQVMAVIHAAHLDMVFDFRPTESEALHDLMQTVNHKLRI